MKRILAALACSALVLACNKSQPPAPPAAEPQAAAQEVAKPAEPAAAAEEKKIEITEPLVLKYIAYERDIIAAMKAWGEELKKQQPPKDQKAGLVDTAKAIAAMQDSAKKFEEAEQKALEKAGLSKDEAEALQKVVGDVATARLLWTKAGGDAPLAEMEKAMKAQLETMPKEQRAEAEAEMAKMREAMTSTRDCRDARKEYGDAAVDVVLKHEKELTELQEQLLTFGQGAK